MAKALFRKDQRVWVESVGAWAVVERVIPAWTTGLEEPARVTYEVGLGRPFHASELTPTPADRPEAMSGGEAWRVSRSKNKWVSAEEAPRHPFPGTHPVVFTDPLGWGGWRASRAEYDRDPERIEAQARLIANAPALHAIAVDLITLAASGAVAPEAVRALARRAASVELELRDIAPPQADIPAARGPPPQPLAQPLAPAAARPPPSGMTAASLTERMAALERELNRRPAASADVLAGKPAPAPPPPAPAPRAEREFYASPPTAIFARGRPK